MCHEYRVPQWEEPIRNIVFRLPNDEHVGYIVESGVKDKCFYFMTNQGIEVKFEDTRAGSKIKISYNGLISEIKEKDNGALVIYTDCLHKINLMKPLNP